jgi:hypothetical protein
MADIIAVIEDPNQSAFTATITGDATIITSSTLSNPQTVDSLSAIGDVDTTVLNNGSVLVYKTTTNKWTSTTTLDAQNMEGGEF